MTSMIRLARKDILFTHFCDSHFYSTNRKYDDGSAGRTCQSKSRVEMSDARIVKVNHFIVPPCF